MNKEQINWPLVCLILGIAGFTLAADIILSLNNKPTEAVLTTILALLAGFGFMSHNSNQRDMAQIKEGQQTVVTQTNGRMTAMQDQQDKMIDMIKDLALRVPAPSSNSDQSHDPNL